MTDVFRILYEVCGDEAVWDPDFDLLESGVLDSLAMIELFSRLEDEGIELQPTRINRELLRMPRSIRALAEQYAGGAPQGPAEGREAL